MISNDVIREHTKEKYMNEIKVIRGREEWVRAGAYSVRIQGMNRQHHIPLEMELDEHDCEDTWYVVLLDDGYPVATCRFYEVGSETIAMGRVVVLPEYRGRELGSKTIREAEQMAAKLGYKKIEIESRTVAIPFYEKNGYTIEDPTVRGKDLFECVRMSKYIL